MTAYLGDRAFADRATLALGTTVRCAHSPRALDALVEESPDETLVVIGPDVRMETATEIAERYRVARPWLGIVLVRQRADVATLAQAMRSGIREVVAGPDAAELAAACQRSQEVSARLRNGSSSPSSGGRGKIVAVFASKGGCGKTTVSTNLAAALASAGARTCLVDFDLQFGDVGIALQLEPTRSVGDAIGMSGGIDDQAIASLVLPYRPRLDVLLAPPRPADAEFVSADVAGELLERLAAAYDVVVVDSPPAFNDVVLRSFDVADEFILVTTLDVPSLKGLKVTLETLDALGYPRDRWTVVLNRSDSRVGLSPEDVERSIGLPVETRIPSSSAVPSSINQGVTLVDSAPRHPVSRAISQLAASLLDEGGPSARRGAARRPMALLRRGH